MKKTLGYVIILSCTACFFLSGCGDNKQAAKQPEPKTPAAVTSDTTIMKDGVSYTFNGSTRYAEREDVVAWIKKLQAKYPNYKNWAVTEHKPSELGESSVTMVGYGPKHQAIYKDANGQERKGFDYVGGQIYITGCKCHKIWRVNTDWHYHMGEKDRKFTQEKLYSLPKSEQYYQKSKDGKHRLYHSVCMDASQK